MSDIEIPSYASQWKYRHLKDIGVQYKATCDSLSNLTTDFGNQHPDTELIVSKTSEYWDFPIKLKNKKGYTFSPEIKKIKRALRKLNNATNITGDELTRWKTNLKEFLTGLCMVLLRWNEPTDEPRECVFTHLFMTFARIAFLYPEHGEMYNKTIKIGREDVNGMPDVRFETFPDLSRKSTPKLIAVTEVKNYKIFRKNWGPKDTFTCLNMSPDVLGQHGIELLLEMDQSLFKPTIYGCICIGSYIIITRLTINDNDLDEIKTDGKLSGDPAIIEYSKPFDYLKKADRGDILKFFISISRVQSNTES